MFRLATLLSLVALAPFRSALAQDGETCPNAIPLSPDAVMMSGDTFNLSYDGTGDAPIEYFTITVEPSCKIVLRLNSCSSTTTGVVVTLFEGCAGNYGATEVMPATEFFCDADGANSVTFNVPDIPIGSSETYVIELAGGTPGELITLDGTITGTNANACGDPHFTRWTMDKRDSFHGECDLVLLKKEKIEDDMDLDVHIRTTIKDSYSYIESVAMKLGDDAMVFQKDTVYLNGQEKSDDEFPIDLGNGNKVVLVDPEVAKYRRQFSVTLLDRIAMDVWSTKQFMGVKVNGSDKYLTGSVGMLGDYESGAMIGRDGRILSHFEDMGFEWQVSPSDPKIFLDDREPQLPYERCRMPSVSAESRRRKLRGQDRKLYEQALEACTANHIPENVQSCVDDVMFTGEMELAMAV